MPDQRHQLDANEFASREKIRAEILRSNAAVGLVLIIVLALTLAVGLTGARATRDEQRAVRAEMDSVDQGVTALAASSASFDAPTVKVNLNQIGGSFQGDLSADKSQLAGSWTQGGQTFPLKLERAKPEAAPAPETEADYSYASPAELQGHWRGTLAIQAVNLRIVFNIARKADATYTATLDSPDQGAGRVPASSVACDAPKAYLEWNGIAAAFDGELKDGRLDGTFTQGGARIPLVLQRDASK